MSLTITLNRQNQIFLNNYQLIKYIQSGRHTITFQAIFNKQIVCIQCLKHSFDQRIKFHQILKSIPEIPRLIECLQICDIKYQIGNQHHFDGCLKQIKINQIFLVTEWIDTTDLEQYSKNLSSQQILDLMYQILIILQKMHQLNVFHLDLKPENILIDKSGKPHLIDLGSCQFGETILNQNKLHNNKQKQVSYPFSTKTFSPHRSCDNQYLADKYDIYQLGCTLYYLLTGNYQKAPLPRFSEQSKRLYDRFGENVQDLLCGMLKQSQELRYSLQQLLQHPAFTNSSITAFRISHISSIRKKLHQFHNYSRSYSALSWDHVPKKPTTQDDSSIINIIVKNPFNNKLIQNTCYQHEIIDNQINELHTFALNHICLNLNLDQKKLKTLKIQHFCCESSDSDFIPFKFQNENGEIILRQKMKRQKQIFNEISTANESGKIFKSEIICESQYPNSDIVLFDD
ncbi:Kinase [Hexamita inflata]|uniref:CAMK CAMKL n=1 Tax=Hexamita inflata TaxID=28002 RepID=A0AA86UGU0_9EUKA|nr:CAMK CAMKL [Hexamita inflata]